MFLLPQAPMITQVTFICSIELVFYTAEAIIEKSVFSSVPAPRACAACDARAAATSTRKHITEGGRSTRSSTDYASRATTRRRRPGAPRATHRPEIKRPPPSTPTSTSTMDQRGSPHSAHRRPRRTGTRRSAENHPDHHSSSSSPAKSKSSRRAAEQGASNTLERTCLARY